MVEFASLSTDYADGIKFESNCLINQAHIACIQPLASAVNTG